MKCPFCIKGKTEVINSRKGKGEYEVWRRRKCFSCSTVFTTREVFSYDSLFVVKRNLNRKRFVYEKLFASILYSVAGGKMRDQGDEADEARVISGKIIKEILKINSKYISSKDIIRIAYSNLEKENHFFAMKYSLYSEFRLKTINEIKKM